MPSNWRSELEAIRERLAEQNELLEQAKQLVVGTGLPSVVPTEFVAEIDRVCDVNLEAPHAVPLHHGAIRA